MISPFVTSRNDQVRSLKDPIHEKISYSDLSKNQARSVHCASDVINTKIKLLVHRTWHSVILKYLLKDKSMK